PGGGSSEGRRERAPQGARAGSGESGRARRDGPAVVPEWRLPAGARVLATPAGGCTSQRGGVVTGVTDRTATRRRRRPGSLWSTAQGGISRHADSPGGRRSAMKQADHDQSRPHAGAELRVAREAAGLTQADVAERLKMPLRVVRSLEDEDWSRLGAPVFVRGQLRSYARLLGIDAEPVIEASEVGPVAPPQLTPRTFTPPWQ